MKIAALYLINMFYLFFSVKAGKKARTLKKYSHLGHSSLMPCILTCLILSGCSNLFNSMSRVEVNTGDIPDTSSSSLPASFQITRVNQTLVSPSRTLDILGDGSGSIGNTCPVVGNLDPNATKGDTDCYCSFIYSTATESNANRKTQIKYHESNLARCEYYESIPFGVATFKVSIVVMKGSKITQNSNIATFSFSGTPALDPKNPRTFVRAKRHLCRGLISIPYLFDSSIIDPDQSESPFYTYPLDYYTTNLASSLAYFINSGDAANECPPVPYNPTDTANYVNIVSSEAYDGSYIIDPPQTGKYDRSTFYLAAKPTGVFAIPVNAVVAPSVVSNDSGTEAVAPPLGYGAAHTKDASGGETCPSNSVIPTDYEWVKLWLFRGAVPERNYFKSASHFASLVCHPGDWTITKDNIQVTEPVFNACMKTYPNDNNSKTLSWSDAGKISNNYLADRVVFSKNSSNSNDSGTQCIQLNARPSGNPAQIANANSPNACTPGTSPTPGVGCGNNSGGDQWLAVVPNPAADRYPNSANLGCSVSTVNNGGVSRPGDDPLHICGSSNFSTGGTNAAAPFIPKQGELTTENMDLNTRYDYLFVVSPTSISTRNIQGSDKGKFTPVRGTIPAICRDGVNCQNNNIQNYITSYNLITNDINLVNPPASNINQQDNPKMNLYPICVVRPKTR